MKKIIFVGLVAASAVFAGGVKGTDLLSQATAGKVDGTTMTVKNAGEVKAGCHWYVPFYSYASYGYGYGYYNNWGNSWSNNWGNNWGNSWRSNGRSKNVSSWNSLYNY